MKSMQQMGEEMIRRAAAERAANGTEWPKTVLVGMCIAYARNQEEFDGHMRANEIFLWVMGSGLLMFAIMIVAMMVRVLQ